MNVFERYAPFIQDYIYRSGWKCLRGVQNAAGEAIFGTDQNVLLTASTASGKTEAAFFPILTLLEEEPSESIAVLAWRCQPDRKAETVKKAAGHPADHTGVPGIPAYKQAHGDSFHVS